jgi:hypothetical protein
MELRGHICTNETGAELKGRISLSLTIAIWRDARAPAWGWDFSSPREYSSIWMSRAASSTAPNLRNSLPV